MTSAEARLATSRALPCSSVEQLVARVEATSVHKADISPNGVIPTLE